MLKIKWSGGSILHTDARNGLAIDSGAILEAVIDAAPDAIVVVDASGQITFLNTPFAHYSSRVFGSAPEPGRPLQSLIARAETDRIREFWTSFLERALGGSRLVADAWYPIEGQKRAFVISSTPVRSGDQSAGAAIVVRDITESRAKVRSDSLELNLLHVFSEERSLDANLHHALEFLRGADAWDFAIAWMFDDDVLVPVAFSHDGTPEAVAFEAAVRELRFTPGHGVPGRALREDAVVWVPDLTDETGAGRSRLAAELGFRGVVAVPARDQGRAIGILEFFTRAIRPMNHDVASALDEIGSAVGRMVERRRSEDERRRLHAVIERKGNEWAHTFDAIELPVFLATSAGVITQLNRAACTLAGGDYDDIIGRELPSLGDGELWRTLGDVVRAVAESRTTCSAESVGGGERRWDISGSLYAAGDAGDERVIVVLRDITTLVTLQESVRRGEQLAALGELVAGVAHEVRNPLFGMSATLFAYEPQLKDNPDAVEMFAALRSWIVRLNTLMESLLEYGKTWNVNLEWGNLDEVVDRAIGECAPLASAASVRLTKNGDSGRATLLMDSTRLAHAIQNVILNAIQHAPPGSEVSVTLAQAQQNAREAVECVVGDSGPGFQERDLPRIFQPFFTRRRGGTGLGLSIVQRVIDEHGGSVLAENASSGGALVRMRFPLFDQHPPSSAPKDVP